VAAAAAPDDRAAMIAALEYQASLQEKILKQIKIQVDLLQSIDSKNAQILSQITAQRAENDLWQQRQIFLLTVIALACGIFWGMATWSVVLRSASSKHFW
jgi:hypothetical protein